jgi:hypothetical protein
MSLGVRRPVRCRVRREFSVPIALELFGQFADQPTVGRVADHRDPTLAACSTGRHRHGLPAKHGQAGRRRSRSACPRIQSPSENGWFRTFPDGLRSDGKLEWRLVSPESPRRTGLFDKDALLALAAGRALDEEQKEFLLYMSRALNLPDEEFAANLANLGRL